MEDDVVIGRIERLVDEEKELRDSGTGLTAEQQRRVERLEVELDQCWDLLRQRRAAREVDADASSAKVRDPGTVESYEQ